MTCKECGEMITRYQTWYCRDCQQPCCAKHIFRRVDEANEAITRNAPVLCRECYYARYPEEVV